MRRHVHLDEPAEDAFGIEFTDDEAARIVVGRDLLDLVAARLGA